MLIPAVLLLALLGSPSADFTAAFESRDIGRLMRLWDPASPAFAAGRRRLTLLAYDDVRVLATDGRVDVRDAAGTLLEQYELVMREGQVWSLTPIAPETPLAGAREEIHRGTERLDAGELAAAEEAFGRAIELAEAGGHAPTLAAAQRALGSVRATRGDLPTAECHYELALAISRAGGDRHGEARALERLSESDRARGNLGRAEVRLAEALRIFRDRDHRLGAASALTGLGQVYAMAGDPDGAHLVLSEASGTVEELGDVAGMAAVLNALGLRERVRGAYPEAAALLQRAVELYRSTGNLGGLGSAEGNLAVVLAMQGQYAEALTAFREALSVNERLGRHHAVMVTVANTGETYRILGDYEQAREHFQRALAMAEQAQYKPAMAVALHNLAMVRVSEDDPRGAITLFERALVIEQEIGLRPSIARTLHNIGRAYHFAGDEAAARPYIEKALAVATELGHGEGMLLSLGLLAEIAATPDESLALARRAFAVAEGIAAPELVWTAHLLLGRAHRRAGALEAARREVERAIEIAEQLRRNVPGAEIELEQAFTNMVRPHQEMVGVLAELHEVAGALEYAERAKARVLLDVLRNGRPDLGSALSESERAQESALAAQLAEINRQYRDALVRGKVGPDLLGRLRTARLEYEKFLDNVFAAQPRLRIERGEIQPVRASDAAALLAAGAADAFLEFVVTDEQTYLFTVTTSGLRVHTIAAGRVALKERVLRFRELLASHDLTYGSAARALYDLLLRPAAAQLRGKRTICIVPDGPLWELPFQTLQPAAGEFLLDRHAVYYAPSLTVLRETRRQAAPPTGQVRLIAFGNPVMPKETPGRATRVRREASLEPLPHSETEIRRIAALYGPGNSRVHVRGEAREEVVKAEAGAFDVLHFATHGLLDDQNALYSRLVFSPPSAPGEDGLLEAREIMRLDLRARLAVLSACETARGRVGAGEGLIGLSWALFVAGVPATVVSQWSVDSESTAALMIEFHRNLRVAGRSTAEALRLAALATRNNPAYRHPFYWAPFVAVGSAR